MTTQELRIGNYIIRNSTGDYQQVQEVLTNSILLKNVPPLTIEKSMTVNIKSVSPIPLTEEILLKCHFGFKNKGFDDLSVSYEVVSKKICICIGNYYKHIDYLHQLQNIIFDLTGEELKINL